MLHLINNINDCICQKICYYVLLIQHLGFYHYRIIYYILYDFQVIGTKVTKRAVEKDLPEGSFGFSEYSQVFESETASSVPKVQKKIHFFVFQFSFFSFICSFTFFFFYFYENSVIVSYIYSSPLYIFLLPYFSSLLFFFSIFFFDSLAHLQSLISRSFGLKFCSLFLKFFYFLLFFLLSNLALLLFSYLHHYLFNCVA